VLLLLVRPFAPPRTGILGSLPRSSRVRIVRRLNRRLNGDRRNGAAPSALRKTIAFLRGDAHIPNADLLPYGFPVVALARFFSLHPQPNARSRELLSRWVWRGALTDTHWAHEQAYIRETLRALEGADEELEVQQLLELIPQVGAKVGVVGDYSLKSARTRLHLLALLDLRPRDLASGELLDGAALIARSGSAAIQLLADVAGGDGVEDAARTSIFGRVIQRPMARKRLNGLLGDLYATDALLESLGLDREEAEAVLAGRPFAHRRAERLRSLAGVQPKLSMIREGRGMTLPASGRGGDWIVKLPGNRYRGVPENEFATMNWARRVGIDVPETELISTTEIRGLPPGLEPGDGMAFAIRRFDRPAAGRRVHIEDFAQIRDVYPDTRSKYGSTNYETIAKFILRTLGESSFKEFVRRLAFIIVSANADAHIKNWSVIYPDRQHAQLSPAYDLVSTIEFIEQDALALNLAKTKEWRPFSFGTAV